MALLMTDAQFTRTVAIPSGGSTANAPSIDLQVGVSLTGNNAGASAQSPARNASDYFPLTELRVTIPALSTSELPDGETIAVTIQAAGPTDPNFGSPTTLGDAAVATGSGGAGSAAVVKRFRVPGGSGRYFRASVTASSGAAATAADVTTQLYF